MSPSITDIKGIIVGSQENLQALTGCTVVLTGPEGAVCGVDVRGAAPGTRETDLLAPYNMIERVHAVLLAGGSSYGLDAAGGVMEYLEEKDVGHRVGTIVVPIVPAAVLFDLGIGDHKVRPDRAMGYAACKSAGLAVREGNAGAGAGATVGKIKGYQYCTKGGLGSWSIQLDSGLTVGAIVAVNAFGDIVDSFGQIVAGVRSEKGHCFLGTHNVWREMQDCPVGGHAMNTTIAVIACNANLDKTKMTRVAQMAHDALARTINPVHTMCDGDTIFALAKGEMQADVNVVGLLAQEVLFQAILRAVYAAKTVPGCRACTDV